MNIGVLGAGTWGTALGLLLSKNGHDVVLWSALPEEIDQLERDRTHKNLPGVVLPPQLTYTKEIQRACRGKELVLFVVPSAFVRRTAAAAAPYLEEAAVLVCAAKGMEGGTLKTMTEVIFDEVSAGRKAPPAIVALSGPTHAEEVARGLPASIVAACEKEEVALKIAEVFRNSALRVYTNTDVLGVELCGALKNVIAIAAGINHGMGFGDNSCAMLMTRGLSEIARIGIAMGCRPGTFMGLAGMGDLIVTCTSVHSRNHRCGMLIGQGKTYSQAVAEIGMVVEGYYALDAALELSRKYGVEMPISASVYDIIKNQRAPFEVMRELMLRDIKNELEIK